MEHFNKLTPAEAERLALLAEEAAEVIQVVGKILRHGYESYHPADPCGPSNRQLLEKEMGDLDCAMCRLYRRGDVSAKTSALWSSRKEEAVKQYMHHQGT